MQEQDRLMKLFAAIGFTAAWFAVILQYYLLIKNNDGSFLTKTIQFISYFTILTNTLVAIYFTVVLFGNAEKHRWLLLSTTATAIAVYITIVGLIYNVPLGLHGTQRDFKNSWMNCCIRSTRCSLLFSGGYLFQSRI